MGRKQSTGQRMSPAAAAGAVLVLLVAATQPGDGRAEVEVRGSPHSAVHPNHFVVVFRKNATEEHRHAHLKKHTDLAHADPESEVHHNFSFKGFHGYAARFSDELLRSARQDEEIIEYFEFDGIVKATAPVANPHDASNASSSHQVHGASCSSQNNAPWGLQRSSTRSNSFSGKYYYGRDGDGVKVYVLDTGVYVDHEDFEGRAYWGASYSSNSDGSATDKNGHGTHCAGTIGGYKYGMAKKATIVGVQVLSDSGSGTMSGVIKGLEFACQDHQSSGSACVASMSLSGGYYEAMNEAADAAVSCGCVVVVAAGNDGGNACQRSPASASTVVTVGATQQNDERAYFSNTGSCVDIFAPGVYIKSTWIGAQYATQTISGTSMAAPHVAGAAAKLLGAGYSAADTRSALLNDASSGYISNIGNGSPNLLLFSSNC